MTNETEVHIMERLTRLETGVDYLKSDVKDIKDILSGIADRHEMKPVCQAHMSGNYVSIDRFRGVELIVQWTVRCVLLAVLTAILGLVVIHQDGVKDAIKSTKKGLLERTKHPARISGVIKPAWAKSTTRIAAGNCRYSGGTYFCN